MRSLRNAALAATLLALSGCGGTKACTSKTMLLTVTLGSLAASADNLEVEVLVDGETSHHTSIARAAGTTTGTIEISFPSGYPTGKSVTVTVTAAAAGNTLATGTITKTMAADCTTASLTVNEKACVFQSAEDCFNGIDDDCNGMIDCADPACTSGSECVPANADGFHAGTTVDAGSACPAAYDGTAPTDLQSGLSNGGADCTGCHCTATVSCSANLYVYASQTACTADTTLTGGSLLGSINNANIVAECNAHSFTVGQTYRVGPYVTMSNPCTASGTATVSTPSWGMSKRFCQADKVGAGCTQGYVCVAKVSTPHCELAAGAESCSPGYTAMGTWYTGFSDTRSCGACGCGTQTPGDCTHDVNGNLIYLNLYAGGCGSGINSNAPSNSQRCQGINLADGAYGWESFNPKAPSCPPSAPVTGALTATGQQTLCCK
jgi:hypothetical protein